MTTKHYLTLLACCALSAVQAQTEENFDNYGDAGPAAKSFCTQKVLFLSPSKLVGIGYEYQGPSMLTTGAPIDDKGTLGNTYDTKVNWFSGIRLQSNTPLISRYNWLLNLGVTYWNNTVSIDGKDWEAAKQKAVMNMDDGSVNEHLMQLDKGLRTTGVALTLFKPFDDKRFLIVQGNVDVSGNYRGLSEFGNNRNLTFSGSAIYGWKKSDNFMWGLGIARTYRAGQLLHVPTVFYNRTFNSKWGIEAFFPAKVNVRRSFGTRRLLMFGYEVEGNTFYMGTVKEQSGASTRDTTSHLFLRRGEIKPRFTYEQKITGFVWLSVQAGMRVAYRFLSYSQQNPSGFAFGETDEVLKTQLFNSKLGAAPYLNVSLNLVSP